MDPRALLGTLFRAALDAAGPEGRYAPLPSPPRGRTLALGAGKAAAQLPRSASRIITCRAASADFGRMSSAVRAAASAASGSSFSSASRASPTCPRNAVSLSRVSDVKYLSAA